MAPAQRLFDGSLFARRRCGDLRARSLVEGAFFFPVQREISTFFRDNSRVLLQLGKLLQFLVFRFSSEERSPTAPRRGKAPLLAFLSSRRWRAAPLAHF